MAASTATQPKRNRRPPLRRLLGTVPFWAGLVLGGGLATAVLELPYVNWQPAAAPIDTEPLTIRKDAKGDGSFFASRSGDRRHRGIDLAAPLGSSVRAIRSGSVVEVGLHRGLGRFIDLEHHGGLHSRYAHLNDVQVSVGERVQQGQRIGTVGKTGNARHRWIIPHLHLEVVRDGELVDPASLGLRVVEAETDGTHSSLEPKHANPSETDDARGGE